MLTHRMYELTYDAWLDLPEDEYLASEAGWITTYTRLGPNGDNTVLDDWQVFNLNNLATFQLYVKSRQVGFSWVQSLKKLARAALMPGYQGIFTSLNKLESQEKLRYLNMAWETLPSELRDGPLRKTQDNATEIIFANGSRITSFPAKAPRGRAGADVTMDEIAHVQGAAKIYDGTTAASVRDPNTSVELGSSPLAAAGFFHEVATSENDEWSEFFTQRWFVHWWDSSGLCTDIYAARRAAETERWDLHQDREAVRSRVERFGTTRFKKEFGSKSLGAFLQEFECSFTSDNSALIGLAYLNAGCDDELEYAIRAPTEGSGNKPWIVDRATEEYVNGVMLPRIIKQLHALGNERGQNMQPIFMGLDPARSRNQSVLTFVMPDDAPDGRFRHRVLGRVAFRDTPLHIQQLLIEGVLMHPFVRSVAIDRTGIGVDLCDRMLAKFGELVVIAVNFSLTSKAQLGSRLQWLYEHNIPWHPRDHDLVNQIYALKNVVTNSGGLTIQAPDTKDNHADAAWSLALALYYAPDPTQNIMPTVVIAREKDPREYNERRSYLRDMVDDRRRNRALSSDHDYYGSRAQDDKE